MEVESAACADACAFSRTRNALASAARIRKRMRFVPIIRERKVSVVARTLVFQSAVAQPDRSAKARRGKPRFRVPRAVGVHDPRGRARLGERVLRARASRAAAWIVVDFWLHLFIKEKVEENSSSFSSNRDRPALPPTPRSPSCTRPGSLARRPWCSTPRSSAAQARCHSRES